MTVPINNNHTMAALVAGGDRDNNGGVIAHAGTVSGENRQITSKSLLDLIFKETSSGSRVILSADYTAASAHVPGIQAALVAGGTFAYNAAKATRSATDSSFVIQHVPSLLAGKASTDHFMSFPSADYTSRRAGNLHPKTNTYRKGLWSDMRFNQFNGTLTDVDGNAKSTISGRGSSLTFHNISSTTHVDHAAEKASAVRGVTGELVMLINFTEWDKASSPNLIDYSALTG